MANEKKQKNQPDFSRLSEELSPATALGLFVFEMQPTIKVLLDLFHTFQKSQNSDSQRQIISQIYPLVVNCHEYNTSALVYLAPYYEREDKEDNFPLRANFLAQYEPSNLLSIMVLELRDPLNTLMRSIEFYQRQAMNLETLCKLFRKLYKAFIELDKIITCVKSYYRIWYESSIAQESNRNEPPMWLPEQILVHFLLLLLHVIGNIQVRLAVIQVHANENKLTDIWRQLVDFGNSGILIELKILIDEYQAIMADQMFNDDNSRVLWPANISKRIIKQLTDLLSSYQGWHQMLEGNSQENDWQEALENVINIFEDGIGAWSIANKDLDTWLNRLDAGSITMNIAS